MFSTQHIRRSMQRVARNAGRRAVVLLVAVAVTAMGLVSVAAPASAAAAVSAARLAGSGFPLWYEDNAGTRVEACIDANDPNCVLPPASDTFDPVQPLTFPENYPDEFFYALASSDLVTTPGCNGTAPGRASVRLAVEGAFINGAPAGGDQMTFGRIRVKVTSGLCPNTTYRFKHPFATVSLTTNAAGAIPANVGTVDVGCVPTPTSTCNYALATGSPVFGSATGGFLRWDTGAPAGYLGDGVTLHAITGGTNGNAFEILDADGASTGMSTALFSVAGKVAGPLTAGPNPLDLGAVVANTTSPTTTVTVTNVAPGAVTTGGNAARMRGNNGFSLATTCSRVTLNRDQTCTFSISVRSGAVGLVSDTVDLAYTLGGTARTFSLPVSATITASGNSPVVTVTPAGPLAFGNVRVKTASTLTKTVTNTGNASLSVGSVALTDVDLGAEASQYRITAETCTTRTVAVGGTCTITVQFSPTTNGDNPATLTMLSNAGTTSIAVSGTGTGGVAAVSAGTDASDGFPDWYRDENGVKLSQCVDAKDPYCIVLADATFSPAADLRFPSNFPGEFFYTVSDSDLISTPGCNGTAPGKAFVRNAVEGTFVNGEPVATEQMVFGRERIVVTSGLCANTNYTFVTPYGKATLKTNAAGGIARNAGTVDIGCVPVAPALCDFREALTAPVFGGFLRWDPAVAPAAPAGYLGDAASFHRVVGAPYKEDGVNPSNYVKITGAGLPAAGLRTDQFTVMGKLRGPLEPTGGIDASGTATLSDTAVGSTSSAVTVTLTNTGVSAPIVVRSVTLGGTDVNDFAVAGTTCRSDSPVAVGGTCTVDVTFSPSAAGVRSGTVTLTHDGLNNPLVVPLEGTGTASGGVAAISFAPRSLAYGRLAVGGVSPAERITVSNAGGTAPLSVSAITPGNGDFSVSATTCLAGPVAVGDSCTVDVVFSPAGGGTSDTTLRFTDNAPVAGSTHTVALTGSGFAGGTAVSAALDANGFPRYYQDATGTRLEPCLDATNCVLLGDQFYDPGQALSFPDNFPAEFFYAIADSEPLTTSCNGVGSGTALLRMALEGSFATTAGPAAGDQISFTRLRLGATGLCPNVTPIAGVGGYTAVTPYGTFTFGTDANGTLKKTDGTQDTGCGAAPCTFADALASPGATFPAMRTPIDGFLRWDPNAGSAPPAGYLGDAVSLRKVTGGTYVPPGGSSAYNGFKILDPAGNVVAETALFMVAGKVAGPLFASPLASGFGHVDVGSTSASQTVTVTNVGTASTTVTPSLGGANANQFTVSGGTCGAGPVAVDGTCTVTLQFRPTTAAAATASLILTPGNGRTASVALTGIGDAVASPVIAVAPGVLSFGTVTAPGSATLTTTVSNTGAGPLTVTGVALAGTGAGDYARTGGTCVGGAFSVAAGASCTVSVTFTPTAIGARTASLTLSHNASGGSTVVSLTGTGAGAAWTASPSPVGFGTVNVGATKAQTISFKNSGTANGRITAAAIANAVPAGGRQFVVNLNAATSTCFAATPVAPGKTCSIVVQFTPSASATAYSADLAVTDAAALPTTATVRLTGSGR